MLSQAITPITCSNCGQRFSAAAERILDVEKDPSAKSRILAGRVNVARCPSCGAEGALNAPFLYHDRSKELLLCYLPQNFGANEAERQRVVGDLTKAVIDGLPPEQRKAYLLQPKMFFTLQSMIETILQADGITKEMMDAQKAHVDIINALLQASDESDFKRIVAQHKDAIDIDFFDTLSASIEASQLNGQGEVAQVLSSLRLRLIQEFGLPVGEEIAGEGSKGLLTRERLLKKLEEAQPDSELEQLVAVGRPLMDYGFFQEITSQIEAAEAAGETEQAKSLTELRARILKITEEMDAAAKQAISQATELLRAALESDNPESLLRERVGDINEAFFIVLSANMQAAQQADQQDAAEKLARLGEIALQLLQEATPPEIQFLNRLMTAAYPDETETILAENRDMVTAELLNAMSIIAEDLQKQGKPTAADKLRNIIIQAQAASQA